MDRKGQEVRVDFRNRIILAFSDPINRSMIQFSPIQHLSPCQGSGPFFAALDLQASASTWDN